MSEIINIYTADIRALRDRKEDCFSLLTPARQERINKIRAEDEKLWIAAAGLLLAKYLDVKEDSQLAYNKYGRPYLVNDPRKFSISHGGNLAVLAVADFDIGVDVEREDRFAASVMEKFFLPEEKAWIKEALSEPRFAVIWTRKESIAKADGRGLAMPLQNTSALTHEGWYVESINYDGHVISCASGEQFKIIMEHPGIARFI